ncbi:MAG: hypothetical protein ACLQVL_00590 [Terriglobia bacterium]
MGAAIAVIQNIQVEYWYADLYGAMSLAYRLSALVKNRAAAIKLVYHVRHLDSILEKLFKDIHTAMKKGVSKDIDSSPESIAEAAQSLRKLHAILNKFQQACKIARLSNNSLMAGHIHNINNYNEEILELIELIDLSLHPAVIDSIYSRAKRERERGEIFDLSEV